MGPGDKGQLHWSFVALRLPLIVSLLLHACSKAPSNGAAGVPSAGGSPKPVATSEAKRPSAGARPDPQSATLEKNSLMAAVFPGWKPPKEGGNVAPTPDGTSTEAPTTPNGPGHLHIDKVPQVD